ncbi:cobalamin biosynthesis protein [Methylobacterium sp. WL9]|uniref:cobalamin biosynthesis protein n=1 Tax=Methylobacterium sp. WL9 TaxID=2603898 RepID=UPI0011CABC61|nr:cobalamin biosynthesis protein [Methylobacterium sp. WL9]TXN21070.1 cobalamin biosynthesis protein [Methylobacterium sp. WL9]
MGLDKAVTPRRDVVAGVGFRHATTSEEIVALVRSGLATAGVPAGRLNALATADDRADEIAFRAAAVVLGCETIGLPPEALRSVDDRVPTRSVRIEAERGVGSLAEAAALVGAGERAMLILPRIASVGATCALALVFDSE